MISVAIDGPSGAGKSTIAYISNGIRHRYFAYPGTIYKCPFTDCFYSVFNGDIY